MSLVASLGASGVPILLGDLLLSGPETGKILRIPTVGEHTKIFPEGSGFVPVGLMQKTAVLGEKLAIGWAGSAFAAKVLISRLKERIDNNWSPRIEELMEYFREDAELNDLGFQLTGYLRHSTGLFQFCYKGAELKGNSFGRVILLGSGTQTAQKLFERHPGFSAEQLRDLTPAAHAASLGLSAAGLLLAQEISTLKTLSDYFGAGYEVIIGKRPSFQKVNGITFVFWYGEVSSRKLNANPYQIYKTAYESDFLMIRTATLDQFTNNKALKADLHTYVVPPAYVTSTLFPSKTAQPSWTSPWVCNIFALRGEHGELEVFFALSYLISKDPPIIFKDNRGAVVVGYKKEFFESILRQAVTTYDPKRP